MLGRHPFIFCYPFKSFDWSRISRSQPGRPWCFCSSSTTLYLTCCCFTMLLLLRIKYLRTRIVGDRAKEMKGQFSRCPWTWLLRILINLCLVYVQATLNRLRTNPDTHTIGQIGRVIILFKCLSAVNRLKRVSRWQLY